MWITTAEKTRPEQRRVAERRQVLITKAEFTGGKNADPQELYGLLGTGKGSGEGGGSGVGGRGRREETELVRAL